MKDYINILKRCTLFRGFEDEKLLLLLDNLNAREKSFRKNQVIYATGSEVNQIGVIVSGTAHIEKTDIDGNKNIIMKLRATQTFGETLGFGRVEKSPVDIVAATASTIIFLPVVKIIETCLSGNEFSVNLIKNTSQFVAQKSMMLHIKNDILAQKSIRTKLMSYFYYESDSLQVQTLEIPFSREGLADFLSVNPSALSRELGKMRDDGLITFKRNRFTLTKPNNNSMR